MVRALHNFLVPCAAHYQVSAVPAHVHERPQPLLSPHDHDGQVEDGGGK